MQSMKRSSRKLSMRVLSAVLACTMAVPVVGSLSAAAKAAGTPINMEDLDHTNRSEAMQLSVIFPYINGDDVIGSTLTGHYTMSINGQSTQHGQEGQSDQSTYQWYIGDTRNGEYTPIDGETARTYQIKEGDVNKYIRFEVTPVANGKTGRTIQSDPVGPIMTQEDFDKITLKLTKEGTYLEDRNKLDNEVSERFGNTVYFNVEAIVGGQDKTPVSDVHASKYYYKDNIRHELNTAAPTVSEDGTVMVNQEFVTNVLGGEYDFKGAETASLDDVAAALGKQVFYADKEVAAGTNGNYRTTAKVDGLIIVSDEKLEIDVIKDRDVLNEVANRLYDLHATDEELEWFREARFGMFIHWDPGTMSGREIGWGRGPGPKKITNKVPNYDLSYLDFNPSNFDAPAIAKAAKEMGVKYLVFTSKHHAGFTSWNTNYFPEHSIAGTPYAEGKTPDEFDIIEQLADACHAEGLKFGLYYSPQDWYNDYCWSEEHYRWMETYLGHLTELMSNYGKIDIFWCDAIGSALTMYNNTSPTGYADKAAWSAWDPRTVLRWVKQLQPGILTNDRYVYRWEDPKPWEDGALPKDIQGDYITPEQTTSGFNNEFAWESCLTIDSSNAWSYNGNSGTKDPAVVTQDIIENGVNDGNVLLNIGLMPNGEFSERHMAAFQTIGDWMNEHGESLYGTRGGPYVEPFWGGSTYRVNEDGTHTVYLHISAGVNRASQVQGNSITIPASPDGREYTVASLFGEPDVNVDLVQNEDGGYTITLPEGSSFADGRTMETLDTIIVLEEDFNKAVEKALQDAKDLLAKMDEESYPEALKAYRSVLQERHDALANAEGQDNQEAALKELKDFNAAYVIAESLNTKIEALTKALAEATVGEHSWELSTAKKASIQGHIDAALELFSGASVDTVKLNASVADIQADQQFLDNLANMMKVTIAPGTIEINPESQITLTTANKELEVRYTTDGSDPTADSKLYTAPIVAPKQGAFTIKAANFYEGELIGTVSSQLYAVKSSDYPANLALNKSVACSEEGFDLAPITDGTVNTNTTFTGVIDKPMDITIDLGEAKTFNRVFLSEEYWIGHNEVRNVTVQYSTDGEEFKTAATQYIMAEGVISFDAVNAQYVRIHFDNCLEPIVKEISVYNSQKPDFSFVTLAAENNKFLPGQDIKLSVNGEVAEEEISIEDVTIKVTPEEAGTVENGVLHIAKDFNGESITLVAEAKNGDLTIVSQPITLTTALYLNATKVTADEIYDGNYSADKAFDKNMLTRWATKTKSDHSLNVTLDGTGYSRIVIKEYTEPNIISLPTKTRMNDFQIVYTNAQGQEVVAFDTENPEAYATYTFKAPNAIHMDSSMGQWVYVDNETGEVAHNRHDILFNTPVDADNFTLKTKGQDVTIWEIEVMGVVPEEPSEPANKDNLAFYLDVANKAVEAGEVDKLVADVKARFLAAVAAGEELMANEKATQEEVDAAATELRIVINMLSMVAGDKTLLNEAIAKAEALLGEENLAHDYEKEFIDALRTELEKAKIVADDGNALQGDVDAATEALLNAIEAVLNSKKDWRSLDSLIKDGESIMADIEAGKFIEGEAVDNYKAAYDKAINLPDEATQTEINEAADALRNASIALRYKADKSVLEGLMNKADGTDTSMYTAESVEALNVARAEAQVVFDNANATQDEVNAAAAKLDEALASLSAKDVAVAGDVTANNSTSSVKTGDSDMMMVIVVMMALAGVAVVVSRKRNAR